jgi:hypothetical protein
MPGNNNNTKTNKGQFISESNFVQQNKPRLHISISQISLSALIGRAFCPLHERYMLSDVPAKAIKMIAKQTLIKRAAILSAAKYFSSLLSGCLTWLPL